MNLTSIKNLKIDIDKQELEIELKEYANTYIQEKTLEYLHNRLNYDSKRINDNIGKSVSTYMTSQNITRIIDNVFKQTDIEKVIAECIERQIGKKVKKLLEDF